MSDIRFWNQQDLNPRPGHCHADVLPLHYFDPLEHVFKYNFHVMGQSRQYFMYVLHIYIPMSMFLHI